MDYIIMGSKVWSLNNKLKTQYLICYKCETLKCFFFFFVGNFTKKFIEGGEEYNELFKSISSILIRV